MLSRRFQQQGEDYLGKLMLHRWIFFAVATLLVLLAFSIGLLVLLRTWERMSRGMSVLFGTVLLAIILLWAKAIRDYVRLRSLASRSEENRLVAEAASSSIRLLLVAYFMAGSLFVIIGVLLRPR